MKTAATVGPSESDIAAVAHQLWIDNGCPVGSDQEDWFLAEALLKNGLIARCEDLPGHSSIACGDSRADSSSEMTVEFEWTGHWEVWEMEWDSARWVWD